MPTGTAVTTGDTITAAKMNAKLENVDNDDIEHAVANEDAWVIGVDAAGQDITIHSDTASRAILYDSSAYRLTFQDNMILAFGDAFDAALKWTGSALTLVPVGNDTGSFIIGSGTLNFDIRWYGAAAKYVTFDVGDAELILEDVDLHLGDTDSLIFGDGDDVVIQWTSALLTIIPATDDTGAVNFGNGTKDIDVKIFLGTTGEYAEFNVGDSMMKLVGTASTILSITSTLTGSTSDNAVEIDVTDEMTIAGGMNRALHLNYDATGVQTGTSQINALAIDMSISNNVIDWMPITIYTATVADKSISKLFGISMYFEDFGNAVADFAALDIGYNSPHAPSGRNTFMRLRQHNTVQSASSIIKAEGGSAAAYLLDADTVANMLESGDITSGKTCIYGVRCNIAGTVGVIPLFAD